MPRTHGGSSTRLAVLAILVVVMATGPGVADAQLGPVIAGGVLGTAGGAVTSLGLITAQARAGHYLHSAHLIRWQMLPVPVGAVIGATLGAHDGGHLWHAVRAGGLGLLGGVSAGALAGRLIWRDAEGTWAGAVIGGAAGLVVGSFVGALAWENPRMTSAPLFALSIPTG